MYFSPVLQSSFLSLLFRLIALQVSNINSARKANLNTFFLSQHQPNLVHSRYETTIVGRQVTSLTYKWRPTIVVLYLLQDSRWRSERTTSHSVAISMLLNHAWAINLKITTRKLSLATCSSHLCFVFLTSWRRVEDLRWWHYSIRGQEVTRN